MTENPPDASGNRWEPTEDETAQASSAEPAPDTTSEAAPRRSPSRVWAASGAAVAVLLAGGVGGFAVGRTTAGDGAGPAQQQGVPTGFDRDGDGGSRGPGGPGSEQGGGLTPPDGQVPGGDGAQDGAQDGASGNGTGTSNT